MQKQLLQVRWTVPCKPLEAMAVQLCKSLEAVAAHGVQQVLWSNHREYPALRNLQLQLLIVNRGNLQLQLFIINLMHISTITIRVEAWIKVWVVVV